MKSNPPCLSASPAPLRRSGRSPQPPRGFVLVVEDDPIVCGLHAAILKLDGYEVTMAEDGLEALSLFPTLPFDLVLTDCSMPRMDGHRLVRELRKRGSQVPIVMVSGSIVHTPLPPDVAQEVAAALPKPAHPGDILRVVSHTLGRASAITGVWQKLSSTPP